MPQNEKAHRFMSHAVEFAPMAIPQDQQLPVHIVEDTVTENRLEEHLGWVDRLPPTNAVSTLSLRQLLLYKYR